jgi:hypothetical protein
LELFLNLVWLTISLVLVCGWLRAVKAGDAKAEWKTLVALSLLLVLLFPVISITDDLVAMTATMEGEHMVRRLEMSPVNLASVDPFYTVALTALLFASIAFLSALLTRVRPRSLAIALRSGFARTAGVRPPPVEALQTA